MASRPLLTAEAARARHTAETQRSAEIAQRYPGWTVWAAREGNARVATRSGNPRFIDDGLFAATLICDDWTELEHELAEQAQADAERACP
jgi:hypothetical protein